MYGKIYKWKQEKPKEAVCVPTLPPPLAPEAALALPRPAATTRDSTLSSGAAARFTSPLVGC